MVIRYNFFISIYFKSDMEKTDWKSIFSSNKKFRPIILKKYLERLLARNQGKLNKNDKYIKLTQW